MRVLAIDTALAACSAAVLDTEQGGIIAQRKPADAARPCRSADAAYRAGLDEAGTAFRDLDRVVVTTGPGSFTGLRVGIAAARGIALAADKPAVGVSTLSAYAAPYLADDDTAPVVAAIDARHSHVYLQVFAAGGRTVIAPAARAVERSGARGGRSAGAHRRLGRPSGRRRACRTDASPLLVDAARRARHRLGRADGRRVAGRAIAAETAISARARRAAAKRRATAAPMMGFVARLLGRAAPAFSKRGRRCRQRSPPCTQPRSSAAGARMKSTGC